MMFFREVNGKPYLLDCVSIEEIKRLDISDEQKNKNIHQAMSCGGFFAALLKKECIPSVNTQLNGTIPTDRDYPIITVITNISNLLSEEQVRALIIHEEGHIVHEDVHRNLVGTLPLDLICIEEQEIAADAFAVKIVGKDMFKEALYAAVTAMSFLIAMKGTPKMADEYFQEVMGNQIFQARMKALA